MARLMSISSDFLFSRAAECITLHIMIVQFIHKLSD